MQKKAITGVSAVLLVAVGFIAYAPARMTPAELEAVCGMARVNADEGKIDRALALYEDLLRRTQGAAYVRLGLASALCRKGDWREAENHYRILLAADPDSAIVLFDLGQCLLAQARRSEAHAVLSQFTERYGASFPELASRAADELAGAR